MDKSMLSERDICTKFITPAIKKAGWDLRKQIREEVAFTDGRVIVQGKLQHRGQKKRADYILYYKPGIPVAIIEAKRNTRPVGDGMQQALEYAEILHIPFVFTSNGDSFVFHDKTVSTELEIPLEQFPSPALLWQKYLSYKGLDAPETKKLVEQDYHISENGMTPRYYQQNAINRTLEAIAKGQQRILLVMATGTGKTYTAFNIIWRLWKAGIKKRILFLADRNMLLDQTKTGDFAPFGNDIMHIIKNRKIDKSYQIYFALYQGLTSNEEEKNAYKEFSRDFFDLVVIDECHRGSASEASAWREVLTWFSSATHIGMTATPKETEDVSNIAYFGEPVYTYSLKQGIEDGFLAPYKVVRISTTVDEGWRPTRGLADRYGHQVEDRIYNLKDYDRTLVIDDRTRLVASKITEFLKETDRFAKTIVFCIDIEHANRMRMALVNENADLVARHPNYVVKITGDDEVGKRELDHFTDVEERFPVIATTSKMLTTGVDTKMVKLVVLEANIGSMTEFKQIVGRGTRIREAEGKLFFTIMDFRKATNHFADPDFDGEPVQIYEPAKDESPVPPDMEAPAGEESETGTAEDGPTGATIPDISLPDETGGETDRPRKFYVDSVPVTVAHEQVQYYGSDGKLITESLKIYTRTRVLQFYDSVEAFRQKWDSAEKKEELLQELSEQGVFWDALQEEVGKDLDPFDLICHVAFDRPPLTRKQRANGLRQQHYFDKYGETARKVLESLLAKYEEEGVEWLEKGGAVLKVNPLSQLGQPVELVRAFGKKKDFYAALNELKNQLYQTA